MRIQFDFSRFGRCCLDGGGGAGGSGGQGSDLGGTADATSGPGATSGQTSASQDGPSAGQGQGTASDNGTGLGSMGQTFSGENLGNFSLGFDNESPTGATTDFGISFGAGPGFGTAMGFDTSSMTEGMSTSFMGLQDESWDIGPGFLDSIAGLFGQNQHSFSPTGLQGFLGSPAASVLGLGLTAVSPALGLAFSIGKSLDQGQPLGAVLDVAAPALSAVNNIASFIGIGNIDQALGTTTEQGQVSAAMLGMFDATPGQSAQTGLGQSMETTQEAASQAMENGFAGFSYDSYGDGSSQNFGIATKDAAKEATKKNETVTSNSQNLFDIYMANLSNTIPERLVNFQFKDMPKFQILDSGFGKVVPEKSTQLELETKASWQSDFADIFG